MLYELYIAQQKRPPLNIKKHLLLAFLVLVSSTAEPKIDLILGATGHIITDKIFEDTQNGETLCLALNQLTDDRILQPLILTLVEKPNIQLSILLDEQAYENFIKSLKTIGKKKFSIPKKSIDVAIKKIADSVKVRENMHHKFVIGADRILLTGSSNGTTAAFMNNKTLEQALLITNPEDDPIAKSLIGSFAAEFNVLCDRACDIVKSPHATFSRTTKTKSGLMLRDPSIERVICTKINDALPPTSIFISIFTLNDCSIIEALCSAASNRCNVHVVTSDEKAAVTLMEAGANVYVLRANGTIMFFNGTTQYDVPSTIGSKSNHQKMFILGDDAYFCSGNLTYEAQYQDNNLIVLNDKSTAYQASYNYFQTIFEQCNSFASDKKRRSIVAENRSERAIRSGEKKAEIAVNEKAARQIAEIEALQPRLHSDLENHFIQKATKKSEQDSGFVETYDGNCIVCLEAKASSYQQWPCGHKRCCLPCYTTLLSQEQSCPYCRQVFRAQEATRLKKKAMRQLEKAARQALQDPDKKAQREKEAHLKKMTPEELMRYGEKENKKRPEIIYNYNMTALGIPERYSSESRIFGSTKGVKLKYLPKEFISQILKTSKKDSADSFSLLKELEKRRLSSEEISQFNEAFDNIIVLNGRYLFFDRREILPNIEAVFAGKLASDSTESRLLKKLKSCESLDAIESEILINMIRSIKSRLPAKSLAVLENIKKQNEDMDKKSLVGKALTASQSPEGLSKIHMLLNNPMEFGDQDKKTPDETALNMAKMYVLREKGLAYVLGIIKTNLKLNSDLEDSVKKMQETPATNSEYSDIKAHDFGIILSILRSMRIVFNYHANPHNKQSISSENYQYIDNCCWFTICRFVSYQLELLNELISTAKEPSVDEINILTFSLKEHVSLHKSKDEYESIEKSIAEIEVKKAQIFDKKHSHKCPSEENDELKNFEIIKMKMEIGRSVLQRLETLEGKMSSMTPSSAEFGRIMSEHNKQSLTLLINSESMFIANSNPKTSELLSQKEYLEIHSYCSIIINKFVSCQMDLINFLIKHKTTPTSEQLSFLRFPLKRYISPHMENEGYEQALFLIKDIEDALAKKPFA